TNRSTAYPSLSIDAGSSLENNGTIAVKGFGHLGATFKASAFLNTGTISTYDGEPVTIPNNYYFGFGQVSSDVSINAPSSFVNSGTMLFTARTGAQVRVTSPTIDNTGIITVNSGNH